MHAPYDVPAPRLPHVRCIDGYAWASGGRVCLEESVTPVVAPRELVSCALDGEPVDRALACAEIFRTYGEHALRALFPPRCRRCGHNHWSDGQRLSRSGLAVHPEAADLLRRARVPLKALRVPDLTEEKMAAGRRRTRRRGGFRGLPVRSTPEATLAAQIAYALARMPVLQAEDVEGAG